MFNWSLGAHTGDTDQDKVLKYYNEVHYSKDQVTRRMIRKAELKDSWYRAMLSMLERNRIEVRGMLVVELGCGLGFFCERLSEMGAIAFATDISWRALYTGRQLVRERQHTCRMTWMIANAACSPFRSTSLDMVVCAETLEHTFAIPLVVREIARVTRPQGYVLVSFPNSIAWLPLDLITKVLGRDQPEQLVNYYLIRRLLEMSGFVIVDEEGADYLFEWGFRVPVLCNFMLAVGKKWSSWRGVFAGTTVLLARKELDISYESAGHRKTKNSVEGAS